MIKLSANDACAPEMTMDDIIAWITREAKRRLEHDAWNWIDE